MALAGAVFALLATFVPPAFALGRHLARGRQPITRVLVGVALAPPAVMLALALVAFARMPFATALALGSFVWLVIALWPAGPLRPAAHRGPSAPDVEDAHVPGGAVTLIALGAALLVALPALAVPYIRYWSDAWFHAGAAIEILRRGMPPQDPNFAGIPLYYPWLFHGLLALLMSTTHLTAFTLQSVLNVWAAVVLVLAAAHLAVMFGGVRAAAWAGAIAVLGLNPFGWVLWLARSLTGHTHGLAQGWASLAGLSGALNGLAWGFSPFEATLLDRFWTGTALTPAIALSLALAWSLADALVHPSRGTWVRSLALALAMTLLHPAYGAVALAAFGLGLAVSLTAHDSRPTAFALMVALVLTAAIAYPYVRACSVPGTFTPMRLGLYRPNLWAMVLGFGPWWLLALNGLVWTRRTGSAARFARTALGAAALMALVVVLPERNSEKLVFLAWVALVPFAGAGMSLLLDWAPPGYAVRALAVVLMVPTSALFLSGALRETRPLGTLIHGERVARVGAAQLIEPGEDAAYQMLKTRTPLDAVVIDRAQPTVNEPIPVLAERRTFCGSADVYLANHFGGTPWGQEAAGAAPRIKSPAGAALREEFLVRRGIQRTLFDGGALTDAQRRYLFSFAAPLYLMVRRAEAGDAGWDRFEGSPDWERAFHDDGARVYRWRGSGR